MELSLVIGTESFPKQTEDRKVCICRRGRPALRILGLR
ncbi:3-hydroxybutyrate dehydrogenase, type 2 (predicted), isoform CRA_c [Rattus norvegicus]|uniref:3-hydroxybutyrate dehydrogenase, type 2 (Predicted), isoform CRA_c n=1 Tax=Rattus norvegicus TaxID=10116 RepID=A6HVW4_RAT|nr:3-hydroxybutyrate dehydrogenase, type 2 (predicted), isoform CRA_c [Rattus norvegicus]